MKAVEMTDSDRERAIQAAFIEMKLRRAEGNEKGAQIARMAWEKLLSERSPEVVAEMERKMGLDV